MKFRQLFSGGPDNHRIFETVGEGRLFIADRSGRSPTETDDLPLELLSQRVVLRNGGRGMVAGLEVHECKRQTLSRVHPSHMGSAVHVTPMVADWLAARWGVPLEVELEGGALVGVLAVFHRTWSPA